MQNFKVDERGVNVVRFEQKCTRSVFSAKVTDLGVRS